MLSISLLLIWFFYFYLGQTQGSNSPCSNSTTITSSPVGNSSQFKCRKFALVLRKELGKSVTFNIESNSQIESLTISKKSEIVNASELGNMDSLSFTSNQPFWRRWFSFFYNKKVVGIGVHVDAHISSSSKFGTIDLFGRLCTPVNQSDIVDALVDVVQQVTQVAGETVNLIEGKNNDESHVNSQNTGTVKEDGNISNSLLDSDMQINNPSLLSSVLAPKHNNRQKGVI